MVRFTPDLVKINVVASKFRLTRGRFGIDSLNHLNSRLLRMPLFHAMEIDSRLSAIQPLNNLAHRTENGALFTKGAAQIRFCDGLRPDHGAGQPNPGGKQGQDHAKVQ